MSTPRMPRWVKLSGFASIILIVIMVVIMLMDATGDHGPFRHISATGQ